MSTNVVEARRDHLRQSAPAPESTAVRLAYETSEYGAAQRFSDRFNNRLRYCPELGSWLAYDGITWNQIGSEAVIVRVDELVNDIRKELKALRDQDDDEFDPPQRNPNGRRKCDLAKQIKDLQRFAYARNVVNWASGFPSMSLPVGKFDDPDHVAHLVNVENGTLDLTTLSMRPHDPNDGFTRRFPVEYHPTATCPEFHRFLQRITCGEAEMIEYLQCRLGSALCGQVFAEELDIAFGEGGDGKSTLFCDIMVRIFGDDTRGYGFVFEPDMLTDVIVNAERPTAMKMRLRGCRLAIFKEPQRGAELNDSRVKALASRDTLSARSPYGKEAVQFAPSHTPVLVVNNMPVVKDCSRGMRRRLRILSFNAGIPMAEWDLEIGRRLFVNEREGIFAWLVEGYQKWQSNGRKMPALPSSAEVLTEQMWEETDRLAAWMADCCVRDDSARVGSTDLFNSYTDWLKARGVKSLPTIQMFGRDVKDAQGRLGISFDPKTQGSGYSGIRLRD